MIITPLNHYSPITKRVKLEYKQHKPHTMRISYSLGSLLSINNVIKCSQHLTLHKPDTIWIPETWGMENFAMLGAISHIVPTANIGSSIINIYSRSPALISMGAVTLDTISQGRLILGLGTSSTPIIQDFHGYPFDKPLSRMREYVKIIKMITSCKQKIDYTGEFFKLKGFQLLIKPYRDKIPIYIAAVNQKMINLTWDIGDGVIFYLRTPSELKDTISTMQKKRKIDVTCQIITAVSHDSQKAINRARATLSFYIAVGKIYREFLAKHGFKTETENIFDEYKKTGPNGSYKELVTDHMLNSLTICGSPDECISKLSTYYNAGVTLPIIQFNPVGDNISESFNILTSTFSKMGDSSK